MILNVVIGEQPMHIDVPDSLISDAVDLFTKMDQDMEQGWQMSRVWVDKLSDTQRCQVVADKLLTAVENENEKMKLMMAAYILYKIPDVKTIYIDMEGDITATELEI